MSKNSNFNRLNLFFKLDLLSNNFNAMYIVTQTRLYTCKLITHNKKINSITACINPEWKHLIFYE